MSSRGPDIPEDTIDAVITAIDSKLASADPLTFEDLQVIEKLVRARTQLEQTVATRR